MKTPKAKSRISTDSLMSVWDPSYWLCGHSCCHFSLLTDMTESVLVFSSLSWKDHPVTGNKVGQGFHWGYCLPTLAEVQFSIWDHFCLMFNSQRERNPRSKLWIWPWLYHHTVSVSQACSTTNKSLRLMSLLCRTHSKSTNDRITHTLISSPINYPSSHKRRGASCPPPSIPDHKDTETVTT